MRHTFRIPEVLSEILDHYDEFAAVVEAKLLAAEAESGETMMIV
jgi:hypothetical protein